MQMSCAVVNNATSGSGTVLSVARLEMVKYGIKGTKRSHLEDNYPIWQHWEGGRPMTVLSTVRARARRWNVREIPLSLHDGSPLGDRSPSHCACVILRHCRLLSTAKPRAHASQRQIRFQSWRKATKASFWKTRTFI